MPKAGQAKIKETVKKEAVKQDSPEQIVISKEDLELLKAFREVRSREKRAETAKRMRKLKSIELKEEQEERREKLRIRDNKSVNGVFEFNELRGGSLSFTFFKHPKDGVMKFTLIDGHSYDVPLCIAEHINNTCRYPVHEHTLDENGKPAQTVGTWVQRASFNRKGFIDYSDSDSFGAIGPSKLVTAKQG